MKQTKKSTKCKQIVIRFDEDTYTQISEYAEIEHRGLGEFVRHAALCYIEQFGDVITRQASKSRKLDDLLRKGGGGNDES